MSASNSEIVAAHPRCPLCQDPLQPWRKTTRFARCARCGFIARQRLPAAGALDRLYQTSWSSPESFQDETGSTDLALAGQYAVQLARSIGRSNFQGLHVLDFGAGTGAMAGALDELGATVFAVEPFGYEYLKQRGLKVFPTIGALPPGTSFDGIVAMQVIEHLTEPWESLTRLRALLKPGGWLFVTSPNAGGLNATLNGPGWREARKPGHLMFFTSESAELLLARSGYADFWPLPWRVQDRTGWFSAIKRACLNRLGLDGELLYLAR